MIVFQVSSGPVNGIFFPELFRWFSVALIYVQALMHTKKFKFPG